MVILYILLTAVSAPEVIYILDVE